MARRAGLVARLGAVLGAGFVTRLGAGLGAGLLARLTAVLGAGFVMRLGAGLGALLVNERLGLGGGDSLRTTLGGARRFVLGENLGRGRFRVTFSVCEKRGFLALDVGFRGARVSRGFFLLTARFGLRLGAASTVVVVGLVFGEDRGGFGPTRATTEGRGRRLPRFQ